jgi:hypothetical protein
MIEDHVHVPSRVEIARNSYIYLKSFFKKISLGGVANIVAIRATCATNTRKCAEVFFPVDVK